MVHVCAFLLHYIHFSRIALCDTNNFPTLHHQADKAEQCRQRMLVNIALNVRWPAT